MPFRIIGDIAGRYDELMLLLEEMPPGYLISVGDLIDRGPKSREVIEFFMDVTKKGTGAVITGNHEDLMVDNYYRNGVYESGTWYYNGGGTTLDSFNNYVSEEVIKWLSSRPYCRWPLEDVLVSHSFVAPHLSLPEACNIAKRPGRRYNDKDFEDSIIWNRQAPIRREYFQIAGHNSQWGYREFEDDNGKYAVCIDNSRNKKLTGLYLKNDKTYDIYSVNYLEG